MNALEMHVILITILLNKVTKTNLMLSFVVWNLYMDGSIWLWMAIYCILYMTKAMVTMQFKAGMVLQLLHTWNMDSNPALSTGVCLYFQCYHVVVEDSLPLSDIYCVKYSLVQN